MKFTELAVRGAFLIEPDLLKDDRGFFARTWCAREFEQRGLNSRLVQCSVSYNRRKGTLRGIHYQAPPRAEDKLVRCTMGAVYDVLLDLRRESPTFGRWTAVELTATNRRLVYIPQGVAHGFQTLCDETEVFYQISQFYQPEAACGVRWNDPQFAIDWPAADERLICDRDRSYPDFQL